MQQGAGCADFSAPSPPGIDMQYIWICYLRRGNRNAIAKVRLSVQQDHRWLV